MPAHYIVFFMADLGNDNSITHMRYWVDMQSIAWKQHNLCATLETGIPSHEGLTLLCLTWLVEARIFAYHLHDLSELKTAADGDTHAQESVSAVQALSPGFSDLTPLRCHSGVCVEHVMVADQASRLCWLEEVVPVSSPLAIEAQTSCLLLNILI